MALFIEIFPIKLREAFFCGSMLRGPAFFYNYFFILQGNFDRIIFRYLYALKESFWEPNPLAVTPLYNCCMHKVSSGCQDILSIANHSYKVNAAMVFQKCPQYSIVGNSVNIHPTVNEAASIFTRAGKQVYLVGGAVRDLIRGRKAKDWDLATDALPEEVIDLFRNRRIQKHNEHIQCFVIPTGIKHGTVTVHYRGFNMEVTTFRSESGYSDGRRPDKVEFGSSMEEDLSRRDFTMNAAAYKLPSGPLLDPFNGRGDIEKHIIRCVGNPEERFSEDGLRPVRALRFASQLNFTVDRNALAAIPGALALTAKVAPERIRDELDKILAAEKPSTSLLLMEETGLLKLLLPELAACRGVEQKGFHQFDVLDHSLLACDFAAAEGMGEEVRLAALYHDTGKPGTVETGADGVRTFYRHEKESSALTRNLMLRFKYPNAITDRVCHLIEEHMFHYDETWTDAAVRRFIIRAGEDNLRDLYDLRRADAYGMAKIKPPPAALLPLIERIETILAQSRALSLRDLAISGRELIKLGIPPGKHMGIILNELLEAVLEDPGQNTKETLVAIARNIYQRYLNPL